MIGSIKPRFSKSFIAVTAVLLIVAGSVAFALLQSQAELSGNSIETDSASLLISPDDTTYSNAAAGYKFAHIIPGSQASQTEHLFLRNMGAAPLALKVGMPGAPDNPDGVDLSKVNLILTPYDMTTHKAGTPQDFSLQALIAAGSDGVAIDYPGGLDSGAIDEFDIQIAMAADAINGSGASLSSLDLMFTGVAAASTS